MKLAALPVALAFALVAPAQRAPEPFNMFGRSAALEHYERVERELRRAEPWGTPAQQAARANLLDLLRHYRTVAEFGRQGLPGTRTPYFVDAEGRRCAVAFLLDNTGESELTLRVAGGDNHAWVADLATDPRLGEWLARNGLTLWEAARIQGPGTGRQGRIWVPDPARTTIDAARGWMGAPGDIVPNGPGAAVPTGATTPRSSGAPNTAAAVTGTASSGPQTGTPLSALPPEDWTAWWAWNRLAWLRPTVKAQVVADGGDRQRTTSGDAFWSGSRFAFVELMKELATSTEAPIRAAALTALGRIGGRGVVPTLTAGVKDAHFGVRHSAILALGSSGATRAVLELSRLADPADDKAEVSWLQRPLAVIALGLARKRGAGDHIDGLVAAVVRDLDRHDHDTLGLAGLLYADLVPAAVSRTAALGGFARELAADERTALGVRSRAIEALGRAGDKATLSSLMDYLVGRRLEARRSAALALGELDHDLALPGLMTAVESEREPLARAFALLSVGRQHHDVRARDFLIEQLTKGRKTARPWAALALGMWNRQPDADLTHVSRVAVRDGWTKEKNHDAKAAYLVAMGLGADRDAVELLETTLHEAKSPLIRNSAVEALAMIGGPTVRETMRERIVEDPCPYTRATIAEVLGFLGNRDDAELVAKTMTTVGEADYRERIAAALGLLKSESAFATLMAIVNNDSELTLVRASAIHALGLMLADDAGYHLVELARDANFTVFPGWLAAVLASTL